MSYALHEDIIEAMRLKFKVTIEQDCDSGRPWKECDGYGVVRESKRSEYFRGVEKRAGERVLHDGGRNEYTWVFDWAATMKEAKRDGWGLSDDDKPANWGTLTKGQQLEIIVQRDFNFLKAWCDEEWVWCGVCVELADYHGPLDLERSLWSVEYWQYEDLDSKKNKHIRTEVIAEMMQDIAETYRAEEAEKQACAERDIVTVE